MNVSNWNAQLYLEIDYVKIWMWFDVTYWLMPRVAAHGQHDPFFVETTTFWIIVIKNIHHIYGNTPWEHPLWILLVQHLKHKQTRTPCLEKKNHCLFFEQKLQKSVCCSPQRVQEQRRAAGSKQQESQPSIKIAHQRLHGKLQSLL